MSLPVPADERAPVFGRRELLRGALAVWLPAVGTLTACGGGSGGATSVPAPPPPSPPPPPSLRPLAVLRQYADASMAFSETLLDGTSSGLGTTTDRFRTGTSRRFSGTASVATIENLPPFSDQDFAVSCWFRSSSRATARILRLSDSSAEPVLALEMSASGSLTVLAGKPTAVLLASGAGVDWVDGAWHHALVQRMQQTFQLFVDGVLQASRDQALELPAPRTLQLGGGWIGDIDDTRLHARAFDPSEAASLVYAWKQLRESNRADGMAGYYPFYGNARNDTGVGIDGVVYNAKLTTSRSGDRNCAYQFDGVASFIQLSDGFDTYEEDYAIGFWFLTASNAPMAALSTRSPKRTLDFIVNGSSGLSLHVSGESPFVLATGASGTYADSRWHFALVQREGAEVQLYVDGVWQGSNEDNLPLLRADGPMSFGRGSPASPVGPGYFDGSLDDIHVYARAFTPREIKALESLQFRPMDGAAALTFNNRLWLLGGWRSDDTPTTHSEVWSSADGVSWSFATMAPWDGRHTFATTVFDGRMWVIGGDRNRGHYQNDVWSSRDGVSWDLVGDSAPWAGRASPYVAAFKDKIWLLGGIKVFEPAANQGGFNDIYSTRDGANWTLEVASAPWSPRGLILGSVVHRDRIWLLGGGLYDQRVYLDDVWSSADGVHWDLIVENAPWSGRQYHNVIVFDGKMWVIAGADADHREGTADVWFSADGVDWTELPNTPWRARHAGSVFVLDRTLWLAAGSAFQLFNDLWSLSFAA